MRICLLLLLVSTFICVSHAKCKDYNIGKPWGIRAYTKKNCEGQVLKDDGDKSTSCENIKHTIVSFHMVSRDGCWVDTWLNEDCDAQKRGAPAPWYSTYWGKRKANGFFGVARPWWWEEKSLKIESKQIKSWRVSCGWPGAPVQ
jgi:hypothetical protein